MTSVHFSFSLINQKMPPIYTISQIRSIRVSGIRIIPVQTDKTIYIYLVTVFEQ